ncbi:follistatin isoform X2 [Lycorma delicatula]|uniref:follistatin isoform X2 n=1 Tax=Lycorma delicatula TaxID=130591 RepID=UPI003F50FFE3
MPRGCEDSMSTLPIALAITTLLQTASVLGGNCWSAMVRNGRCTELLAEKVSREECCASGSVATAWSTDDLDAGALFFWRVLGGGVPCSACKESCTGVQCGEGKKCTVRKGQPKCVCSPDCRGRARRVKGPVCGTDGRSYSTICRLRKRACRKKNSSLSVAYYGLCQSSCDRILCPEGKFCLLDQNLSPHCVRCDRHCPPPSPLQPAASRQVCGADGQTYDSSCHLRKAACRKGKAIPVAYKGKCKKGATCSVVQCKEKQACLTELPSGDPRCVTCSYRCPKPKQNSSQGTICGSNNRTYHSWCHMLKDACATGYVIETKYPGSCSLAC